MIVSKYICSSNHCVCTVLVGQEIDHRPRRRIKLINNEKNHYFKEKNPKLME